MHLLGIYVDDAKLAAILQESHLLAVGAEHRLLSRFLALVQRLFHNVCGIGKRFFLVVLNLGGEELPQAVAFGVVHQRATVGRELHYALLRRSVGYTLGCLIFDRGDIYVATESESHLLAGRRHCHG